MRDYYTTTDNEYMLDTKRVDELIHYSKVNESVLRGYDFIVIETNTIEPMFLLKEQQVQEYRDLVKKYDEYYDGKASNHPILKAGLEMDLKMIENPYYVIDNEGKIIKLDENGTILIHKMDEFGNITDNRFDYIATEHGVDDYIVHPYYVAYKFFQHYFYKVYENGEWKKADFEYELEYKYSFQINEDISLYWNDEEYAFKIDGYYSTNSNLITHFKNRYAELLGDVNLEEKRFVDFYHSRFQEILHSDAIKDLLNLENCPKEIKEFYQKSFEYYKERCELSIKFRKTHQKYCEKYKNI